MSKGRILIDLDGVLADFEAEMARRWNKRWPDDDIERYLSRSQFQVGNNPGLDDMNAAAKFMEIYSEPGFFSAFEPYDGGRGIAAAKQLVELGYDVRILTSAGSSNPHIFSEKANWVVEHLGSEWLRKTVITRDKYVVDGDVLIDDRPDQARGQPVSWKQIIFDQPYNRHVDDCPRISWTDDDWLQTIEQTVAQVQAAR